LNKLHGYTVHQTMLKPFITDWCTCASVGNKRFQHYLEYSGVLGFYIV